MQMQMQRYRRTPKWWKPANDTQKDLFEEIKKDVLSAFVANKEGVLMGSILGFLRDMIGIEMPIRAMGFGSVGEFFFHLDDIFEVRMFDQRRFPLVPLKKFLFVKESAISEKLLHLRNLVSGQHSAKKRGGDPKPNYKNTVPCSSEELLRFGYRPPQLQLNANQGHNRPNSYAQPSSVVSRQPSFPAKPPPNQYRAPVFPPRVASGPQVYKSADFFLDGRKIPTLESRSVKPPTIPYRAPLLPSRQASGPQVNKAADFFLDGRKIPTLELEPRSVKPPPTQYRAPLLLTSRPQVIKSNDFFLEGGKIPQLRYEKPASTISFTKLEVPRVSAGRVCRLSAAMERELGLDEDDDRVDFDDFYSSDDEVDFAVAVKKDEKQNNIAVTTSKENIIPTTPLLVYKNAATTNNDAKVPTLVYKKSVITTTTTTNSAAIISPLALAYKNAPPTTSKPGNSSTSVYKNVKNATTNGTENISTLVYKNATTNGAENISTLVYKNATTNGTENISALVDKNPVPCETAAVSESFNDLKLETTKKADIETETLTDKCINKIEYSHSIPDGNQNYIDPIHDIEFAKLECGPWIFQVSQYNNSSDFMVVNSDANSKKMLDDMTTELTGWYNFAQRSGKLEKVDKILDKGMYCGFCEETKTWCRVQVDMSNKLDNVEITAFFSDYGKLRQISCQNLYFLKEKYSKFPRQAFFAEADFSKDDLKYSESCRLTLEKLFQNSEGNTFEVEIQNIRTDSSIIPFLTLSFSKCLQ